MATPLRTNLWCAVLAVNVVAVGVYLAAARDSAWQISSFFVPLVMAVGLLAARTHGPTADSPGPLWLLLGAQTGYLVTSVFWYPVPVASGEALAFPSFVDAMYFVVYATYAVFLLTVLRRRGRRRAVENRLALVDALILATSMSVVLWVAVVKPNLAFGTSTASTTVALLYPSFTLLLFVLAAWLAVGSDLRRSVPGVLMLVWVAVMITGDTMYAMQSVNGSFRHGNVLSVAWMVSNAAIAALAVHPGSVHLMAGSPLSAKVGSARSSGGSARHGQRPRTVRLILLLAAALLTVLVSYADGDRSMFLLGASMVAVTLVIYRTSLLAGDLDSQRRLAAELNQAVRQLREQQDQLEGQAVELELLAHHDSVTGLGNRALLQQRARSVNGSLGETTLFAARPGWIQGRQRHSRACGW